MNTRIGVNAPNSRRLLRWPRECTRNIPVSCLQDAFTGSRIGELDLEPGAKAQLRRTGSGGGVVAEVARRWCRHYDSGRPGRGDVDADRRALGGIRRKPSEGCPTRAGVVAASGVAARAAGLVASRARTRSLTSPGPRRTQGRASSWAARRHFRSRPSLTCVMPIDMSNPGSDPTTRFEPRAMRVELD